VPIPFGNRTAGFIVAIEARADGSAAGLGAVRHMATITALLVSNLYRERELARRRGAEVLGRLLGGPLEHEEVAAGLTEAGLGVGPLVLAKLHGDTDVVDELHHRVCDLGIPHMLLSEHTSAYLTIEDSEETFLGLVDGLDLVVGTSAPFDPDGHWVLARLEADKTLERALTDERTSGSVSRYSRADSPLEWLPSDPKMLKALSDQVLRPLREYDREHNSSLEDSLRVYFEHERRLSQAAASLYVHKHTLAYRLKRIEEISGRRLARTDDMCVLYLALKASEVDARTPLADRAALG
jgi:PucR family transcriptional regulator, purine catabolism regulatory protein